MGDYGTVDSTWFGSGITVAFAENVLADSSAFSLGEVIIEPSSTVSGGRSYRSRFM